MTDGQVLPGTAIEWYAFGALLVVGNVVIRLLTGHTLAASFAMGLFYGLAMAMLAVILVAAWATLTGDDAEGAE